MNMRSFERGMLNGVSSTTATVTTIALWDVPKELT